MGTCWNNNCGKQVTLKPDEVKCDNCGMVLAYICHTCKNKFEIVDNGKKRELCAVCGYFICPQCSACGGKECQKNEWREGIIKIYPGSTINQVNEAVDFMEKQRITTDRKWCPERQVPISYAKSKNKSLLAKQQGFMSVKRKKFLDIQLFKKRESELISQPLGKVCTISEFRNPGTYGQEYKDAFNLLVCLGKYRIIWQKKDDDAEAFASYERVNEEPCTNLLNDQTIVINECTNPKCSNGNPKRFTLDVEYCDQCIHRKGKNKGKFFKTKARLTNVDLCQAYRGDFKKELAKVKKI